MYKCDVDARSSTEGDVGWGHAKSTGRKSERMC